jgi:hypothetical protein
MMELTMLTPDLASPEAFTMSVAVKGIPPMTPTTIVQRIKARKPGSWFSA